MLAAVLLAGMLFAPTALAEEEGAEAPSAYTDAAEVADASADALDQIAAEESEPAACGPAPEAEAEAEGQQPAAAEPASPSPAEATQPTPADPAEPEPAAGPEPAPESGPNADAASTTPEEQASDAPDAAPSMVSSTAGSGSSSQYASVSKLMLNKSKVKIVNDGKFTLKVTLIPDVEGKQIQDKTITWRISNPKIASITDNGVVQGKKSGTVVVTAIAANGKKVTAKVRVVVKKSQMAKRIPVLTYHRICKDSAKRRFYNDTNLAISESDFKRQMKWLKKHGYRTITTEEFRDWRVNGTFLPKKSVLITIDDGFYETYHVAYPILKKYKLKATSFVIGKNIGKKTSSYKPGSKTNHYIGKDVIDKLADDSTLDFQSHTYNLHVRGSNGNGRATFWGKNSIKADFAKMDKYGFTAAAWPFGHTSKNLKSAARSSKNINIGFGYMMDYAASRKSPLYNIPRFKVFGDRGLGDFKSIVKKAR